VLREQPEWVHRTDQRRVQGLVLQEREQRQMDRQQVQPEVRERWALPLREPQEQPVRRTDQQLVERAWVLVSWALAPHLAREPRMDQQLAERHGLGPEQRVRRL
jgi:hypothetical protein